jgi:signal transduction histidine kinase
MSLIGSARFVNRWTQAATVVTVASGLFVPGDVLRVPVVGFWCATGFYLALLTGGVYLVERSRRRWAAPLYFVVASGWLGGLLFLAQGRAWIIGLPLLSHVVLLTSWRWALLGTVTFVSVVIAAITPPTAQLWSITASISAAAIFVVAFSVVARREIVWRVRSEQLSESLSHANQQLRNHAVEVAELSAMRERNRVAREVHDGLGHYLTTIHVQLEASRALLDKDVNRARQGLERAQLLARQGLQDVRESVSLLRGAAQREPQTLEAVLAELVDSDLDAQLPKISLDVVGVSRRVSDTVQHVLRRVLQEALTNVRRHSTASHVKVQLAFAPNHVVLDVENDGNTAPSVQPESHREGAGYGLMGIRERVHLLGGKVAFGNNDRGGFRLAVTVPA